MGTLGQPGHTYVDNGMHQLHHAGRVFACDRDIEALAQWQDCVLLLSSDTDCLSLWDRDGLIRTARTGVYPQDMAVTGDMVCVCGGADSMLHLLSLPALQTLASHRLPGMPERVALQSGSAYVLTLLAEEAVCTALLRLDLLTGEAKALMQLPGLPGAITAADDGLWLGVSEQVLHLPYDHAEPDILIDGFGLARLIEVEPEGVIVTDELEDRIVFIRSPAAGT
ncbi:MAG: hypothetical protein IJB81_14135 [Clostridia bacterium]|nr:hypothetical protein [Clostridia bacterium]